MALIPPFYLDCVVAIGAQQNGTHQWMGTGFLFGYRDEGYEAGSYTLYLVTNKHVFKGFDHVYIRFNPQGRQPAKVYNLDLISNGNVLYKQHPNQNVDIAVAKINAQLLKNDGIRFSFFRCDQDCYYISDLKTIQVTEGDGIFALGYPMGNVGANRQYVIVRNGSLARVRDMLDGYSSDFIIDAFVFPGNSGGPVIIKQNFLVLMVLTIILILV